MVSVGNSLVLKSHFDELGQHIVPLGTDGGDEGIKLTPDGDEAGRPIPMVLSWMDRRFE